LIHPIVLFGIEVPIALSLLPVFPYSYARTFLIIYCKDKGFSFNIYVGRWVRAGKDVPVFLLFSSSSSSSLSSHTTTTVPTTLNEALQVFFGSRQYHGPRLIVLFLSVLLYHRIELDFTTSTTTSVLQEIGVAGTAVVFW
jgi:hypothetical protein